MAETIQEKKWAENELVFRQANEKATGQISKTLKIAEQEDQLHTVKEMDSISLQFYCECSDENCKKRIFLTTMEYTELHQNKSQFMLLPGHHLPQIERVVMDNGKYLVVEKYISPPKKGIRLRKT